MDRISQQVWRVSVLTSDGNGDADNTDDGTDKHLALNFC